VQPRIISHGHVYPCVVFVAGPTNTTTFVRVGDQAEILTVPDVTLRDAYAITADVQSVHASHNRLTHDSRRVMWRIIGRVITRPPISRRATCSALRIPGWTPRFVKYLRRIPVR